MKKFISFIRHSHPEIYKGILFCIAVAALVFIFPKQGKFKYEFQNLKGKPWLHEDLIAPFDFAIKKSADELQKEKSEILANAKPYFKFDKSIVEAKKKQLKFEIEKTWDTKKNKTIQTKALAIGEQILDSIYKKGILEPNAVIDNKSSDFSIYVIDNNIAEEHELRDFYTITSAFEYQQAQLANNNDSKQLLPILENCIAHTIFYDKGTSDKILKQSIDDISPSRDKILKEQSIISKGEIIDAHKFQILESLKSEYEGQSGNSSSYLFILLGQVMIVTSCLFVLIAFLGFFRKDIFLDNAKITFILILVFLQVLMAHFSNGSQSFSIYLLPFCI